MIKGKAAATEWKTLIIDALHLTVDYLLYSVLLDNFDIDFS